MVSYFCKECGYRFENEKKKEMCPYCGKKSVAVEQTAEEIVEDIEKILE